MFINKDLFCKTSLFHFINYLALFVLRNDLQLV